MNKKLIAAAIAAAIAAPTAALANDVTVYGVVHASVDWLDSDIDGIDGFDVASRATRLGFKGTEDLANGLKAIWKMEFQVDIADAGHTTAGPLAGATPTTPGGNFYGVAQNQDSTLITARNAYIGLAGGWGTALVGRHDTPYKMSTGKLDLFSDQLADYNSTVGMIDIRANSAVAYVSPSWSGFSFAAAGVMPHIENACGPLGNCISNRDYDADSMEAYSVAATYDNAGFFATVAWEQVNARFYRALGAEAITGLAVKDSEVKWRAGLGYTGGGFTVGAIYEDVSDRWGVSGLDEDGWQISAGYTFGNNMVKAMYGQRDYDGPDTDSWAIGLDHNLSKRTKAYIQYVDWNGDNSDSDVSGLSVGMIHSF